MSVSLVKGQKVELRKSDGGTLKRVVVGLGWDEAEPQQPARGILSLKGKSQSVQSIDCDASAIVCTNGRLARKDDVVYFGNLHHVSGAIVHMGDNLTGEGEGDDEQIAVDLDSLPADCDKIIFVVNIYMASKRHQSFGMIKNAFIRIFDADTNQELCKYNLSENYDRMTAMVFGELYRHNGAWKFNAIGQGTTDDDIHSLSDKFK